MTTIAHYVIKVLFSVRIQLLLLLLTLLIKPSLLNVVTFGKCSIFSIRLEHDYYQYCYVPWIIFECSLIEDKCSFYWK